MAAYLINCSGRVFQPGKEFWHMSFDITSMFDLDLPKDLNLHNWPYAVKLHPLTLHFYVKVCIPPPVLVQARFSGYLLRHCE